MLTGRTTSLLAQDLADHAQALNLALNASSVLVIGGAGSIGSETVLRLADFPLKSLTIVDQDENGLTRLMRRLRGRTTPPATKTISTLPLDFGSPLFFQAAEALAPFDYVLNFAALKHVRSERDVWSILRMMETNILFPDRLIDWLTTHSPNCRYFSVSTDKAANPVSFMGATKRLMEHITFRSREPTGLSRGQTSARFANVAYSQGSLLESFVDRLNTGVPLAAPKDISRFFMTLPEAGEFCLLSGVIGQSGKIYIPDLDPAEHLVTMEAAAIGFLNANGFAPEVFALEDEKTAFADLAALRSENRWPLILTPSDTSGEKPYEEFAGAHETPISDIFTALRANPYSTELSDDQIASLVRKISDATRGKSAKPPGEAQLKTWVADLEPAFREAHIASDKSLDDRI